MTDKKFPSPFEVEGPVGADGWEELYPPSSSFGAARRDYETDRFWL
jgi:pyruvate, water dikinase